MNSIYIAFLAPNNKMGRFIRFFTRNPYSHVAVSLNASLETMYSFARKVKRIPFAGGFVTEYPSQYLFGNQPIPLKLAKVNISDKAFTRLISVICDFKARKEDLIYNSIDAVSASLLRRSVHIRDCYTCISFCSYLLGLRNIFSISDLEKKLQSDIVFVGDYKNYVKVSDSYDSSYFDPVGPVKVVKVTFHHFGRLFRRLISKKKQLTP